MEDHVTGHDGRARPMIDSECYGSALWQIFHTGFIVMRESLN